MAQRRGLNYRSSLFASGGQNQFATATEIMAPMNRANTKPPTFTALYCYFLFRAMHWSYRAPRSLSLLPADSRLHFSFGI